jgi:hypothetical protein
MFFQRTSQFCSCLLNLLKSASVTPLSSLTSQMFVFLTVNVAVQIGERASYSDVTRISSMLPGSPPLWLTRSGSEYFVNGAQVQRLSNVFSFRHYIALEEILYLGIRLGEDWFGLLRHGFKVIVISRQRVMDYMFTNGTFTCFPCLCSSLNVQVQSVDPLSPWDGKRTTAPKKGLSHSTEI